LSFIYLFAATAHQLVKVSTSRLHLRFQLHISSPRTDLARLLLLSLWRWRWSCC